MGSMQLSFSQLCNPLLCSGLVSLLPRFTTIIEKAYLCVFVCHTHIMHWYCNLLIADARVPASLLCFYWPQAFLSLDFPL